MRMVAAVMLLVIIIAMDSMFVGTAYATTNGSNDGAYSFYLNGKRLTLDEYTNVLRQKQQEQCMKHGTRQLPYPQSELQLHNTDRVLRERIPDIKDIVKFVKQIDAVCSSYFMTATAHAPQTMDVIVAIKPNNTCRFWLVYSPEPALPSVDKTLLEALQKVEAPYVRKGPVSFGMKFLLWGARENDESVYSPPVFPKEWGNAASVWIASLTNETVLFPDSILSSVWPDDPKDAGRQSVPKGYTIQKLEPLGGKVLKPDGWFYSECHTSESYVWKVTKEDPSKGQFITGRTIQVTPKFKERAGKAPRDFALSFIENKAAKANVLTRFPETSDDFFKRSGIEVEEPIDYMGTSTVYHIIYSTYYLDGWDTFIVVTDGTTTNLWPEYNAVFRIMSPMELIDIERLEKTPQADSTNTARKGGKPSL